MTLIPVKTITHASGHRIKFPDNNQEDLCAYINKYSACIPILLTSDGLLIRESHNYLYEKHLLSKGMSSFKTMKTYSECLNHWFEYCSSLGIDWRESSFRSVIAYRNSMKSSSGQVKKSLKSTTINLRTTVVVDFLKYYLSSSAEGDELHSQKRIKSSELTRNRLSIRGKYSRPTAISAESCRKLSAKLNSAHRLIFIWAISTGLRVSSILSLKTEVFHSSIEEGGGGFIEVLSKGGKYLKVFLTEYVISETRKYIALERRLLELRSMSSSNSTSPMLFINKHGAAVNYECYYAAYKRACKTLGIKSHPHQTRTTFASFMEKSLREYGKENGLDHIKIIQGLLGHASAQTTMMYLESLSVYNVEVLKLLEVNSRNLGDELALH